MDGSRFLLPHSPMAQLIQAAGYHDVTAAHSNISQSPAENTADPWHASSCTLCTKMFSVHSMSAGRAVFSVLRGELRLMHFMCPLR
ncbi:hypothetical protein RRG08_020429 [Elysia crispata]|uniref:Uncharacterized protein n=1 Tax=Elysia crispata TaxID=231223 RepID=A0AAE1E9U0_9GAST|nr:hypothetical protein RRG08_020429 [Elysia crispata]